MNFRSVPINTFKGIAGASLTLLLAGGCGGLSDPDYNAYDIPAGEYVFQLTSRGSSAPGDLGSGTFKLAGLIAFEGTLGKWPLSSAQDLVGEKRLQKIKLQSVSLEPPRYELEFSSVGKIRRLADGGCLVEYSPTFTSDPSSFGATLTVRSSFSDLPDCP